MPASHLFKKLSQTTTITTTVTISTTTTTAATTAVEAVCSFSEYFLSFSLLERGLLQRKENSL